jgi:hypothetical protein
MSIDLLDMKPHCDGEGSATCFGDGELDKIGRRCEVETAACLPNSK